MNKFLKSVADVLETDDLTLDTPFRETEGWCSLKAFGLLVMLDQDYGRTLSINGFLALRTVADLAAAAGVS